MRIVIDARYLTGYYSGIGEYSENLLENLSILDHENEYICFVQRDYSGGIDLGENFKLVPFDFPPLSLKTVFLLHKEIKRFKPDFFHSLFPVTPIFFRGKLLVTVHDLQPLLMTEWTGKRFFPVKKVYDLFYRWMYPHSFRHANWLISVSQATRDTLSQMMPELSDKTIVVHSGISEDAFSEPDPDIFETLKKKHDIPDRYILYVGSTRPNKNLPRMIGAFARLLKSSEQYADVCFVMILTPDRFMADVKHSIETLQLESNIRILEPVSRAEKFALYRYARLLFFATMLEGFGFPLLEAQAQGCPVITSNHHSLPEIAGKTALLCDPEKEEEMTQNLDKLLSDDILRQELIDKGFKNAKRFSWKSTASKVLEIYRHLM